MCSYGPEPARINSSKLASQVLVLFLLSGLTASEMSMAKSTRTGGSCWDSRGQADPPSFVLSQNVVLYFPKFAKLKTPAGFPLRSLQRLFPPQLLRLLR